MAIVAAPKKGETEDTCTRWRVVVRNAEGKQDWTTVIGSRRQAEAVERRKRVDAEDGKYQSTRRKNAETFDEAAKAYIAWLSTTRNKRGKPRSHGTIKNNSDLLHLYLIPRLKGYRIRQIEDTTYERRVSAYLIQQGHSTDVLDRVAKVARAVFACAVRRKTLKENPLAGYANTLIGAPPRKIQRRAFTEPELHAILAHAGRFRPMLLTMTYTGMRIGEVFALRREDLDLDAATVHVQHSWDFRAKTDRVGRTGKPVQGMLKSTKTGETRVLPLAAEVVEALRTHLAAHDHPWVFPTRNGTPYRQDNVGNWWRDILDAAGVPYASLYSMRYSFCSIAARQGVNEFNITRAMGHKNTTLYKAVYAHALPSGMREVADAVSARLAPTPTPTPTPPAAPSPSQPPAASATRKRAQRPRVINGVAPANVRQTLDGSTVASEREDRGERNWLN